MENKNYKDVSLLITHYNRLASLERLLTAFKNLNVLSGEVIVSDDCSNQKKNWKSLNIYKMFFWI